MKEIYSMTSEYITNSVSKKGRQEILDRDDHQSQMRHYSEERGWYTGGYCGEECQHLHVHHIKPQRTGGTDDPDNLITLCSCEHIGKCPEHKLGDMALERGRPGKWVDPKKGFIVHPDMQEALMNYDPSKSSFTIVFDARDDAVCKGEIYWNSDHDQEMKETVRDREHGV